MLVLCFAALASLASGVRPADAGDAADRPRKVVVVARIHGMVDLGLAPFVDRTLRVAKEAGAAAVILDVNTFGGRVDAAVAIRDHLLRAATPTVAFVNKRAISAGALIALAAEKIVMADGATMGAAAPVQFGQPGQGAQPVDEKTVSYVRKEFRATADARKRPGVIAEAMVDADVVVPGLVEKGKLLTLTTAEALQNQVANFQANDLAEVLPRLGLAGAEVRVESENWAERVVRFLTHPILSSLLISIAVLGILVELRTPGFGIPGLIGLLSLAAFFWGHWLVQLVGWEELLAVAAGLVLLAVEIFVLPGFGVAGILGILALAAGLTSSLIGSGATVGAIAGAAARVAISGAIAVLGTVALLRFLPTLPGARRLVLSTALPQAPPAAATTTRPPALGDVGVALTALRPAGTAELDGRRVDVVSDGSFIAPGAPVRVVEVAGHRVVVEARDSTPRGRGESE